MRFSSTLVAKDKQQTSIIIYKTSRLIAIMSVLVCGPNLCRILREDSQIAKARNDRLVFLPNDFTEELEQTIQASHSNDTNDNNANSLEKSVVVYDPLGETEFDEDENDPLVIGSQKGDGLPLNNLVIFDPETGTSDSNSTSLLNKTSFDDFDAMKLSTFYDRSPPNRKKRIKKKEKQRGKKDYPIIDYHNPNNNTRNLGTNNNSNNNNRTIKSKAFHRFELEADHYKAEGSYAMEASSVYSGGNQVANMCAMQLAATGSEPQGGACITYGQVELAVRAARRVIRYEDQADDLNSLEPSEQTVNTIGELNEWTTRILASRFPLSADEIALDMSQIDIRRTSLWRNCPRIFRLMPFIACPLSRYRSHNGECNNLMSPHLGASYMPFVRQLLPQYGDSIGAPRISSLKTALPAARLVALSLHPDLDSPSNDQSVLFTAWGQLINHDLALAAGARPATGHNINCCKLLIRQSLTGTGPLDWYRLGRGACMPIEIGADDPVYSPFNVRCHEFKRSIAGLRPGCTLGPRAQLNMVTSYVDASFVYGSTRSTSTSLRARRGGLLATWSYFRRQNLKPLLPPQLASPNEECVNRRPGFYCFRSGDSRTNQQVQLVVLHTIHTRQHNRLATQLSLLNPHWSSARVYEEARHIHIALVQHILISEYLPILLGKKLLTKHNLVEADEGSYWDEYDPTLNAGISHSFAAAAFRHGHSSVSGEVHRVNVFHQPTRVYALRHLFRQPWPLFEPGAMDEFILGMTDVASQNVDHFVSAELSGHLLQEPNEPVGMDLIAMNIQRGRDQGVAGYNAYRQWCGLDTFASFDELKSVMDLDCAQTLKGLYESIDDVDLFSGGLLERPTDGAQIGPTFGCIIGRQFGLIRSADRFWFESSQGPHAFTLAQLDSIKQVTLARILCANSDNVFTIQTMALRLPHPILNPTVNCIDLPDLDLSLWLEPQPVPVRTSGDDNDDDWK